MSDIGQTYKISLSFSSLICNQRRVLFRAMFSMDHIQGASSLYDIPLSTELKDSDKTYYLNPKILHIITGAGAFSSPNLYQRGDIRFQISFQGYWLVKAVDKDRSH